MSHVMSFQNFLLEKAQQEDLNEFFSKGPSPVEIIKKFLTSISFDKFKELMRKNDKFYGAVYHAIEDELGDEKEFDKVWNTGGEPARFEFVKKLLSA